MADALRFANERLSKAANRLKEANEELAAAEREHRIAGEWVEHLEKHPAFEDEQSTRPTPTDMAKEITAQADR